MARGQQRAYARIAGSKRARTISYSCGDRCAVSGGFYGPGALVSLGRRRRATGRQEGSDVSSEWVGGYVAGGPPQAKKSHRGHEFFCKKALASRTGHFWVLALWLISGRESASMDL